MIDVSYQSIQSGMVKRLCKELHAILDNLPKEAGMEESLIKVGFVTYSNNIHFYNVKVSVIFISFVHPEQPLSYISPFDFAFKFEGRRLSDSATHDLLLMQQKVNAFGWQ